MTIEFVRSIGNQPGVQLAPIEDRTGQGVLGDWDLRAALVGKFSRGRIDKPFLVHRGNFEIALGTTQSIAISALSEAHSHVRELLEKGAQGAVVSRLVDPQTVVNSYAVFTSAAPSSFSVSATVPTGPFTFAVRSLDCHNDGIRIQVHAAEKKISGTIVNNDMVTVRVLDADGRLMHEVHGSLTIGSMDEFGQSNYLPDVSENVTDTLEWVINTGAIIAVGNDGYGRNTSNNDNWADSGVMLTFSEGSSVYAPDDLDAAVLRLESTELDFGYIISAGTRSVGLLTRLLELSYRSNRCIFIDVPGEFTKDQAIAFVDSLGDGGGMGRDHYPAYFWGPLRSYDALHGNVATWGFSSTQAGLRCARNAITNAYGLADKHVAIAGVNGSIGRAQVKTLPAGQALTQQDLSDLADARIIPVIWKAYANAYVFADALTRANSKLSYRKLTTVADMSAYLDEAVVRFGNRTLFLDMESGMARLRDYLRTLFENAKTTGWLVDSPDGQTPAYTYEVVQAQGTSDRVNVRYWLHYNGLIRQIRVKQFIV